MTKLNIKGLMNEIKETAKSLENVGVPFMEGRQAGETKKELIGVVSTLEDYGFIEVDGNEITVFIIKEDKEKFYFSGKVLTDTLHTLEEKFGADALREVMHEEGIEVTFGRKISKNKKEYTTVKLFPND